MKSTDLIGQHLVIVSGETASERLPIEGIADECAIVGERRIPLYLLQYRTMDGYPGPKLPDETYLVFEGPDQPTSLAEATLYSVLSSISQIPDNISRETRIRRLGQLFQGYFVKDGLIALIYRVPIRVRGRNGYNGTYLGGWHRQATAWPYVISYNCEVTIEAIEAVFRAAGLTTFGPDEWVCHGVARRAVSPHFTRTR